MVKVVSCSGEDCHECCYAFVSKHLIVSAGVTRIVSVALTVRLLSQSPFDLIQSTLLPAVWTFLFYIEVEAIIRYPSPSIIRREAKLPNPAIIFPFQPRQALLNLDNRGTVGLYTLEIKEIYGWLRCFPLPSRCG